MILLCFIIIPNKIFSQIICQSKRFLFFKFEIHSSGRAIELFDIVAWQEARINNLYDGRSDRSGEVGTLNTMKMGQSGNVVISMGCILQKLRGWSSAKAFRWFIVTLEVELPFARTSHRPPLPPIFPPNPRLSLPLVEPFVHPFCPRKYDTKSAFRHHRYREQPFFRGTRHKIIAEYPFSIRHRFYYF